VLLRVLLTSQFAAVRDGDVACFQCSLDSLGCFVLQKNTSVRCRQSSSESILIESALEAFSFLDYEDYTGDER